MPITPLFINANRNLDTNKVPDISQGLDSVRAFGWEIIFHPPQSVLEGQPEQQPFRIAARSVSPIGYTSEDIPVHRVNDVVFYPGKSTPTELTVVFDDLYRTKHGALVYKWFQQVYNPVTGELTPGFIEAQGNFKTQIELVKLNGVGQPFTHVKLVGCYPKSWEEGEFNYSTNEFHTVTAVFRWDFAVSETDVNVKPG